ncbi:hypothetical protein BJV82DRAFT_630941 [Fennellomyces sp. T-0311]|nr:hypothetical protein BJV82DRAFT_630941 [Fennellomyces sp. T-0311]
MVNLNINDEDAIRYTDRIMTLPYHIITDILGYLTLKERIQLTEICKTWRHVILNAATTWQHLIDDNHDFNILQDLIPYTQYIKNTYVKSFTGTRSLYRYKHRIVEVLQFLQTLDCRYLETFCINWQYMQGSLSLIKLITVSGPYLKDIRIHNFRARFGNEVLFCILNNCPNLLKLDFRYSRRDILEDWTLPYITHNQLQYLKILHYDQESISIHDLLPMFPNLQVLMYESHYFYGKDILDTIRDNCPYIKTISFENSLPSENIPTSLLQTTGLRRLCIPVSKNNMPSVAKTLCEEHTTLESIQFDNNCYDENPLAMHLGKYEWPVLRSVTLCTCYHKLDRNHTQHIAQFIRQSPVLQHIRIENQNLDDNVLRAITELPMLYSLEIAEKNDGVTTNGLAYLLNHLQRPELLQRLSLVCQCGISNEGIEAIGRRLVGLEVLVLKTNRGLVNNATMKFFVDCLADRKLIWLDLHLFRGISRKAKRYLKRHLQIPTYIEPIQGMNFSFSMRYAAYFRRNWREYVY